MKRNILFLINGLRYGGMERQIVELIKALRHSEFRVYLAVLNVPGPYSEIVEHYIDHQVFYLDRRKARFFCTTRKLSDLIRVYNIDIIHVQDSFSSLYALSVSKKRKIILINGMIRNAGISNGLELIFEKLMLFFYDIIIANNLSGLNYYNISNGYLLYNIVEYKKFKPSDGSTFDIIMNANFHQFKDHYTFLIAIKTLNDLGRIRSVGLIGDGPTKNKYQKLVNKFGLENIVKFYGFRKNIEDILVNYGIGVLCSTKKYKEGVSNSILEYMASGLITVASDIGATSEIIKDGKNGFLFEVENPDSLVSKIITIQDNQKKLSKIKDSAYLTIKSNHSSQNNIRSYKEIINTHFNEKKRDIY